MLLLLLFCFDWIADTKHFFSSFFTRLVACLFVSWPFISNYFIRFDSIVDTYLYGGDIQLQFLPLHTTSKSRLCTVRCACNCCRFEDLFIRIYSIDLLINKCLWLFYSFHILWTVCVRVYGLCFALYLTHFIICNSSFISIHFLISLCDCLPTLSIWLEMPLATSIQLNKYIFSIIDIKWCAYV